MRHFKVKISTTFLIGAHDTEEAKDKAKARFTEEGIDNNLNVKEISESELVGLIIKTKHEVIR